MLFAKHQFSDYTFPDPELLFFKGHKGREAITVIDSPIFLSTGATKKCTRTEAMQLHLLLQRWVILG